MKPNDRFEDQFAALAKRMQPVVDDVTEFEFDEALLVDFHAGLLPPEEAARVSRLVALSPRASDYLAKLELDQQQAAEHVDRQHFTSRLTHRLSAWRIAPVRSFSLAGAAVAAALLLVFVAPPFFDSPPDFGDGVHQPLISGQRKAIVELPGGARIGDVDANWALHAPVAGVKSVRWFVWDRVEGASAYDVQLIGPQGQGLHIETGLSDPHLKLTQPVRSALQAGAEHAWIVEAKNAEGQLLARGVARFVLLP